ncbi:MAG: hypothetical protein JWM59_2448 [Verrucomicrobiales bacterium]|nr:hypothetical protein [Verrucomicrobiales bacterium]
MNIDNWIALAIAAALLIGSIILVDRRAQREFDDWRDRQ